MHMQIKAETFVGFVVVLIGLVLTASPLRDITWASEYRKRWVMVGRQTDESTTASEARQEAEHPLVARSAEQSTRSMRGPVSSLSIIEGHTSLATKIERWWGGREEARDRSFK